jgi:RNA-directed DNA polymerase
VNTPAPLPVVELAQERVLGWQTKLHRWAAEDENKRFSDLFNLLCDPATLVVAWERVKQNRGSKTAGVDGDAQTDRADGRGDRAERAQTVAPRRLLCPAAGTRAQDPKARVREGQKLGLPALRDRIVQMAAKLVLEPIFEADFGSTSFGFRPGRRAQDAIEEARRFINPPGCYEWVIEGDVENCFGALHHGLLMEQVRRRVTDKRALALIRQFLAAGVMSELGTVTATPSGAPPGAILSPVLANVALSVLDRHFEATWRAHGAAPRRVRLRAKGQATHRLIGYADDFLVMVAGTRAQAEAIKKQTTEFMAEQMRLTLSPQKTAITHVDDGFDFLGWHVNACPDPDALPSRSRSPATARSGTPNTASRRRPRATW